MEYILIYSAESMNDLVFKVNEKINDGWEPQGGICFTGHDLNVGDGISLIYVQAMILKNKQSNQ